MSSLFQFKKVCTHEEMLPQFELVAELTPSLSLEQYAHSLHEMIPHNYYQVLIFKQDTCIGVSGYWLGTKLYCGRYLEIDNFVITANERNGGAGAAVLAWLTDEAKANECKVMMLDAYVDNFKGHRFYYKHHFNARGYHFVKKL